MAACWMLLSFFIVAGWSPASAPSPPPTVRPQPAATFPPHGGAFVTSLPGAASAWLDGAYVGATPVYVDDLLPGRHSLTLSSAGWQPLSTSFDVSVGRITPVSVVMGRVAAAQLSSAGKGQGTLTVTGAPTGARIFIDGVAAGAAPIEPHQVTAGYHIVTLEPPGKNPVRSTRIVNVFPNVTTAIAFSVPASGANVQVPPDDILEPVDNVVPGNGVVIAGNDVIIHYRGIEVQCAIGSRSYTFNGKPGTLSVSPALVAGKVYLPQSLLVRLAGK